MNIWEISSIFKHLLKLLDFNPTCNPWCLTMGGNISAFLRNQFLLDICTRGSWIYPLEWNRYEHSISVHTFCCSCVIYVHESRIFMSVQLCMLLYLQPWFGLLSLAPGEGIECISTEIQSRFQALPSLQKRCNWHMYWNQNWRNMRNGFYIPMWTIFFQLEWFIWASSTSCRWARDIPRMLREMLLSGAHKVSIISPSTCFAPGM